MKLKQFSWLLALILTVPQLFRCSSSSSSNAQSSTATVENPAAKRVYGQGGSFTSATQNSGGVSADSLSFPAGVAISSGGIYIADSGNNRVLYFSGTSTTATRVYGQGGSFTVSTANNGGISANSLSSPQDVFADASGVYIVDTGNHRVLYFSGTSTTATRVYGQGGVFTTATSNNGGITANSINNPYGVTADASGVYIGDTGNYRVLFFSGTSTTATRVYGQSGSFTTATSNNGGVSANSLNAAMGLVTDTGGVYVTDDSNSRILYFAGTSTTATRVYGQSGNFGTNTQSNGGITTDSLDFPWRVALNSSGIYITDWNNNRALFYSGTSTTATRVYGQGGSFTTNTANKDGISSTSLNKPQGIAADSTGVYIADRNNHRVLFY